MKVYVLIIGEYEDQMVWGVYSTREKAEAENAPDTQGVVGSIEEHELDESPVGWDGKGGVVLAAKADQEADHG